MSKRRKAYKKNMYTSDEEVIVPKKNKRYKKVVYPSDLMVDFTQLESDALQRCVQYFQLNVKPNLAKNDMASAVASGFYDQLDLDEEESILSFMQRIRNGSSNVLLTNRRLKGSRRDAKKAKKNNSRKRRGEASYDDLGDTADDDDDAQVYCICNKPSYGDMIACDDENCDNPAQWYHLDCVGLGNSTTPPDVWICPGCEAANE